MHVLLKTPIIMMKFMYVQITFTMPSLTMLHGISCDDTFGDR